MLLDSLGSFRIKGSENSAADTHLARRTFFSFQYKPDVTRAWNVRNSWVTKVAQGSREDAGFFDSSVFEAPSVRIPRLSSGFSVKA